jgi:hypothetical protein
MVISTPHGKFRLPAHFVEMRSRSGLKVWYSRTVFVGNIDPAHQDVPELGNWWRSVTVAYKVSRGFPPTDFLRRTVDSSENPLYPALRDVLGEVEDTGATAFVFGERRDRKPVGVPSDIPTPLSSGLWELLVVICQP